MLDGRARARAMGFVFLLTSAGGAAFAADGSASCAKSYENAQIFKKNREYLSARRDLASCIRDCPSVLQRECEQWNEALDQVVPSIVVHAEAGGEDRSDVKIEMDGKVIAQKIDGKTIELEPGPHRFTFTLEGFPSVRKNILMHDGEQLRAVHVVFEKPEAAGAAADAARRPVPTAVYALGGLGLAGVAGFAAFGLVGSSQRSQLERDCSPLCGDAKVDTVHRNLLIADVSLAIGLAALASGAIVWLAEPSAPAKVERPSVSLATMRDGAFLAATLPFQ